MEIYNEIKSLCQSAKEASYTLSTKSGAERNSALLEIAKALRASAADIIEANKIDLKNAKANGISPVGERELAYVCIRTVESDAFSLTNALLDGKMEDAYRYLGDMKQRRVDPISVLGQVSKLYADLLSVALLADEGMGEKEIAKSLGMHEYRAGLYFRSAKRMGVSGVEERLALCTRIDAALKSGSSSYRGLEQLIATLGVK